MKITCDDGGIRIEPEDAQDRAYLRDVLGLREHGDVAVCRWESRLGVEHVAVERGADGVIEDAARAIRGQA